MENNQPNEKIKQNLEEDGADKFNKVDKMKNQVISEPLPNLNINTKKNVKILLQNAFETLQFSKINLRSYFPHYQSLYNYISNYFITIEQVSEKNIKPNKIKIDLNEQSPEVNKNEGDKKEPQESFIIKPILNGQIVIQSNRSHEIGYFVNKIFGDVQNFTINFEDFHLLDKFSNPLDYTKDISDMLKKVLNQRSFRKKSIILTDLTTLREKNYKIVSEIIQIVKNINFKELNLLHIIIDSPICYISSNNVSRNIDCTWKLNTPDIKTRENYIANLFYQFTQNKDSIHYPTIAIQMEGWSFGAMKEFVKYFINSIVIGQPDLCSKPEKITTKLCLEKLTQKTIYFTEFTTLKIDLINEQENKDNYQNSLGNQFHETSVDNKIANIEDQLYQEAVSHHYQDLCILLDKLMNGIILEDFERKLLSENSFILKKKPNQAINSLNKAKEIIDRLKINKN